MGLPTASLGQLPSLQVPYSVPTVGVSKEPKLWEKALLSILANTAGSVMQQGVANSMAPDYAPTPASGFSKFWNGPTISGARAAELDKMDLEQEKLRSEERSNRLARMQAGTQINQNAQSLANNKNYDTQRLAADVESNRAKQDLEQQHINNERVHQVLGDWVAQQKMLQEGKVGDAQAGYFGAQAQHLGAETDSLKQQAAAVKQALEDADRKAHPEKYPKAVNPNIAKFAQSGAVAAPPQVDPVVAAVQSGASEEDIIRQLTAATARQQAVQTQADQRGTADELKAAEQAAMIERIKALLAPPDAMNYNRF